MTTTYTYLQLWNDFDGDREFLDLIEAGEVIDVVEGDEDLVRENYAYSPSMTAAAAADVDARAAKRVMRITPPGHEAVALGELLPLVDARAAELGVSRAELILRVVGEAFAPQELTWDWDEESSA